MRLSKAIGNLDVDIQKEFKLLLELFVKWTE